MTRKLAQPRGDSQQNAELAETYESGREQYPARLPQQQRHRFAFLGATVVVAAAVAVRRLTLFADGRGDDQMFVVAYWSASAVLLLLFVGGTAFGGATFAGLADVACVIWLYGFEAAAVFQPSSSSEVQRSADADYLLHMGGAACLYTLGVHFLLVRTLRLNEAWGMAGGAACLVARIAFAGASLLALLKGGSEDERCRESVVSLVTTTVAVATRDVLLCGVIASWPLASIRMQAKQEQALKSEQEAALQMIQDLALLENLAEARVLSDESSSSPTPGSGIGFGTDSVASGRLLGLFQTTTSASASGTHRMRSFDVLSSFVSNVNMLQSSEKASLLLAEGDLLRLSQASAALQTAHLWLNKLSRLASKRNQNTVVQGAHVGVAAESRVQLLLTRLRKTLKLRGDSGATGLARKFQAIDTNKNSRIDKDEYEQLMHELDLDFSEAEMWALFDFFDRDGSGDIDYTEFVNGVQNQGERSLGGEQSKPNEVCIINVAGDSANGGEDKVKKYVVPVLESVGLTCHHWEPRQGGTYKHLGVEKRSAPKRRASRTISESPVDEAPLFFGVGQASGFFHEAGIVIAVVASGEPTDQELSSKRLTATMVVHLTSLMYRGRRVVLVLSKTARQRADEKAALGEEWAVKSHEMYELLASSAHACGIPIFDDVETACKNLTETHVDVSTVLPAAQHDLIAAREEFRAEVNSQAWDQVMAWEAGSVEGSKVKDAVGAKLPGICTGPLGNPVFTCFVDPKSKVKPGAVFYEDDEMVIFPNIRTAIRSKEGEAAAMSYVHYLIIPKQRIYNAVTLEAADVPMLQRMQQKGIEVLGSEALKKFYLDPESGKEEGGTHSLDLSPELIAKSADQLSFFVHVHPRHSVGHLHIHCCLRNLWTANGNALKHKNTYLADVIHVLNSERLIGELKRPGPPDSPQPSEGAFSGTPREKRKVAVHAHPQDE